MNLLACYTVQLCKALLPHHGQESCGFVGLPTDVILDSVRYGGIISMACHVSPARA